MDNNLHIFVEIPAICKTYECLFSRYSSINDNLLLLMVLVQNDITGRYQYDEHTIIIEKRSGHICEKYVDPVRLNLKDGMTLMVF